MKILKKINKKLIYFYVWGLLALPKFVFAGSQDSPIKVSGISNPLGNNINSLPDFIAEVIDIVILIVTPILILVIIYAGFLFVEARGNPGKLEKAKKTLGWVLLGAVIILAAKVMTSAIQGTVDGIIN